MNLIKTKKLLENNDCVIINTKDGLSYCGFFKKINDEEVTINPYLVDENNYSNIEIEIEEILTLKKLR